MRTYLVLIGCLLLSSPMKAWSVREVHTTIKGSQDNLRRHLLKRCEEGNAASCYDYGKLSLSEKGNAAKARGRFYIRRACTLAYPPACERTVEATNDSKPVKEDTSKIDESRRKCIEQVLQAAVFAKDGRAIASLTKGSVWDTSGVQAGDQITSVNGEAFKGRRQLQRHLEAGKTVVNLQRKGRDTSIVVSCR